MVAAISAFDHEPPLSLYRREKGLSSWPPPDFSQGEEGSQFRFCVPLSSYYSSLSGLRSFSPQRN